MKNLLTALVLLCSFSSCCLFREGVTAEQPAEAWVRASRATHDLIVPRFILYAESDPTLNEVTKQALLGTLADWEFMIRQGEAIYPPPTVEPIR